MKAAIDSNSISIPSVRLPDGTLSTPLTQDMSDYQGRTARVYLSAAGQIEINPQHDSYWLIAEAALPPPATETISAGTREVLTAEPASLMRDAAAIDPVALAANQFVGMVGCSWAPYRLGEDYLIVDGGIEWVAGGRAPQAGDSYYLEIITASTVPITEQRALPLDLAQHAVTLFDLPK